jgi:hypothetical protein
MPMFIQFYDEGREALGSDGCQPVDARLSVPSIIMEAARRACALRNVGKNYTAVRIMRGEVPSRAQSITGTISIKVR